MNMWDKMVNLDSQKGVVRIETFGSEFANVIHPYAFYGIFEKICLELYYLPSKHAKVTLRVDNRQT